MKNLRREPKRPLSSHPLNQGLALGILFPCTPKAASGLVCRLDRSVNELMGEKSHLVPNHPIQAPCLLASVKNGSNPTVLIEVSPLVQHIFLVVWLTVYSKAFFSGVGDLQDRLF